MEAFSCKTKIISGEGAVSSLKNLNSQRLFLVSDPYFVKNGMAAQVGKHAGTAEIRIFYELTPDPTVTQVAAGIGQMKDFRPDTLVALGGGSAIDCAKAICFFSGIPVTFVAIPTTSGSGSEMTDFAILTHNGGKFPLIDPALRPDIAILDSGFLKELPKSLIADSGFDVLAHALEAYVSTGAGHFSDALASEGFTKALEALPLSYGGSLPHRLTMHTASAMAGMAFTGAGLGLCHAMSHALGGIFKLPHGRLNAILLPAIISVNAPMAAHRYAELARKAELSSSADTIGVRSLKNRLITLRKELSLPATLAQAGISPREVWQCADQIVEQTLNDPCCKTNPVTVEDYTVRRILEEVTGRV